MKPVNIIAIIGCIILNIQHSFCQFVYNHKANYNAHSISVGKNENTVADSNTGNFNVASFASDIKVQRAFITQFGESAGNNWSMVGKDFLNRFYDNGNLTNALFNKNGQLIYTIIYTTEKNLPADVRRMVKREYYDYAITMAIEVKEDNRDIWVVKLDDASGQKTIRVEDGEMEQVQQFQKLN